MDAATVSHRFWPANTQNYSSHWDVTAITLVIRPNSTTVKNRLVTQMNYPDLIPCKGINDCFRRILKEEGVGAFYRGLVPRLLSVVPMIGIQFGVYEVRANCCL